MHAKILHRFKRAGSDSEASAQLQRLEYNSSHIVSKQPNESTSRLEYEGSSTSSDPTQALSQVNPNLSEVDQTSTGDGGNRREVPTGTQARASSFFSGATGTIVSGPAHFANTSGAQVAVHIHQPPANFMKIGEQLNPAGLILASPTPPAPPPVSTANVFPSRSSNVGTPYVTERLQTTANVDPPKDNEIYERLLRRKGRGFALFIPQPNRRLSIAYQRTGVRIGDVGLITPYGGFSFLFNICVPRDHPINPSDLPDDFSPLQPALADVDIVEFSQFNPGSYLASASIENKECDSNVQGLHFETSASEGAVLTMPEGAISLDLDNDLAFSNYLEANVRKWYEFVRGVRGKSICNGQIRLVIGCDKTTAWGIATVSGMSQQTTTKLKFKALDTASSSTTTYTWECSGMVEVRVGPDRREIEALRNNGDDGHPLDPDTTFHNQCLFVRTMTATLGNDDWAKLGGNLGKSTVENPNATSGTLLDASLGSGPSGSNNMRSSSQLGSHQGAPGAQSRSKGGKSGVMISTMPDSSKQYHPSDVVNQQLLRKFPDCRMVITKDHAWLSTFREDEEMVSDPEQLLEQVLASHDVRIENGVLRLHWKKQETSHIISSSIISNHVLARISTEDNPPSLTHHGKFYFPSGDLFIVVEKILFRVHGDYFRREPNEFAKLIFSASPGAKPQGSDVSTAIILDFLSSEDFAKFLCLFFDLSYSLYNAAEEDWEVILTLLNRWSFPEVKNLAIQELEKMHMPDVKRIKLYHKHNVDRNYLIPCYISLCAREEPLTMEEVAQIGTLTVTQISTAREHVQRVSRLPSSTRELGFDLYQFIRYIFNISPPEIAPSGITDDTASTTDTLSTALTMKPTLLPRVKQLTREEENVAPPQQPKPQQNQGTKQAETGMRTTPQLTKVIQVPQKPRATPTPIRSIRIAPPRPLAKETKDVTTLNIRSGFPSDTKRSSRAVVRRQAQPSSYGSGTSLGTSRMMFENKVSLGATPGMASASDLVLPPRYGSAVKARLVVREDDRTQDLIRMATSMICTELSSSKPPLHMNRTKQGIKDWDEMKLRMRALVEMERVWAGGAHSSPGTSAPGEEQERKIFVDTLRDGYVLCQLMNKLRSSNIVRPDAWEDGLVQTSNITKFLASCASYGMANEDLFLRDDLVEGTREGAERVARTVTKLVAFVEECKAEGMLKRVERAEESWERTVTPETSYSPECSPKSGNIQDATSEKDAEAKPVPVHILKPPLRSPLRKPSVGMDKAGLFSWARSAASPVTTSKDARSSVSDSTRPSIDEIFSDYHRNHPSLNSNLRQSASSLQTETTATSWAPSIFEASRRSSDNYPRSNSGGSAMASTSGTTSASDLRMPSRDSIDRSVVGAKLVVREDGKPPAHFQLGHCIGHGQFGFVYRALNLNTGQMVAVKRIRLEGLKEEEVTMLMREFDLIKSLSHPSIVKYEGMARDEDTLNIVLEYVENGSLRQTLKTFGKLNERLVASYVVKILEGLHYLHTNDVVHCNLKAANILITKNGNVKLSDFGVSLNLRAMEREIKDVAGTPNWMAPEVIELKGASTKSDIWSLGCTVIELLTGKPPFAEIANSMSVMFRIVEDDIPIPEGSSELRDFLEQCFAKDPVCRPNPEMLCEHPWLKKSPVALKELLPQDSIPFPLSMNLHNLDSVRYLSLLDLPESPISASPKRDDIGRITPISRRPSTPSVRPVAMESFSSQQNTSGKRSQALNGDRQRPLSVGAALGWGRGRSGRANMMSSGSEAPTDTDDPPSTNVHGGMPNYMKKKRRSKSPNSSCRIQ